MSEEVSPTATSSAVDAAKKAMASPARVLPKGGKTRTRPLRRNTKRPFLSHNSISCFARICAVGISRSLSHALYTSGLIACSKSRDAAHSRAETRQQSSEAAATVSRELEQAVRDSQRAAAGAATGAFAAVTAAAILSATAAVAGAVTALAGAIQQVRVAPATAAKTNTAAKKNGGEKEGAIRSEKGTRDIRGSLGRRASAA